MIPDRHTRRADASRSRKAVMPDVFALISLAVETFHPDIVVRWTVRSRAATSRVEIRSVAVPRTHLDHLAPRVLPYPVLVQDKVHHLDYPRVH
jgi:hypothetical protein